MPVYIRKNVSYTPPSLDKIQHEAEDDYNLDPELQKDSLPQPYRMIDKTLIGLFDDTWEVIAKREEERVAEANKVRPPAYKPSVQLNTAVPNSQHPEKQKLSYATCICNSGDGQFIFVGLPCGLVVVDSQTHGIVCNWEEDGAEMASLKSYTLGPDTHMITSIDDMGVARLFAFTYNKLFLIKVLNPSPESENKLLVNKLEASTCGDYMGVVMENAGTHDMWLEVHKLPRDTWVSDLDTIVTAIKKKEEKEKRDEAMSEETESVAPSDVAPSKAETEDGGPSAVSVTNSVPPIDTGDQSQPGPLSRPESGASMHNSERSGASGDPSVLNLESRESDPLSGEYKFGAPQLIMKVKPPQPITGVGVSSLQAACGKVEAGEVVATGNNVLFTATHLEQRRSVFEHLHDNLAKYSTEEETQIHQCPHFHFLCAGKMTPQGLEQANLEGRPTVVAVWWPGTSNLLQYSLIKTAKDVEFKADLVWPVTSKITCSQVSMDTSLIAIGMENGNVLIWDRYMGISRGVVNVRDDSPVVQLLFLDPALYPQNPGDWPPYPQPPSTYVLARCANSALYTITTSPHQTLQLNTVSLSVEKDDDGITLLQPFDKHPDLMLVVTRDGSVQVRDCLQGNVVCQVNLPGSHELTAPWEPIITLGGQGQSLFVKGSERLKAGEESEDPLGGATESEEGLVFVYQLRSFPSLDKYWQTSRPHQPLTVHVTIDQRAQAILSDRLSQQLMRKARMQERWAQMKDEIANIHQLKEVARMNAEKTQIVKFERIPYPHYQLPLP
ncbi:WD repeat-containing protein 93-like isoform X3 [Mya arenaria]|uniref:WD repeat-containing protein 93-like isoform X3 n=1 Tax=Mya arenaria TaxID=6604 RepID=UPI0022E2FFD0|nr:WD repeat-containing protein 93-like isoform X3 [Mya arenaria]